MSSPISVAATAAMSASTPLNQSLAAACDQLVALTATSCAVPIVLLSRLAENIQWCLSHRGFPQTEIPREQSFCALGLSAGFAEIEDVAQDERFRHNPFVTGEPRVRFYAGVALRDTQGQPVGALAVMDRVPRRLSEEQRRALTQLARVAEGLLAGHEAEIHLRRSEEQLRQHTENLDVVVWSTNATSDRLHYVSPSVERVWGFSPNELIANPLLWFESILPEDRHRIEQAVHPAAPLLGRMELEYRIRTKSGQIRHVRDLIHHELDADGRVTRLFGIAQDITGLRALEERRAADQRQMSTLLDTLFGFVGVFDPEGRMTYVNRAALEAGNLRKEDVLGKHLWETYWWGHDEAARALTRDCIARAARGERVRTEGIARTAHDGRMVVDVTFGPLCDAIGRVEAIIGFGVDVTHRKQAELQLARERNFTEAVIDHADVLVVVLDREGRIRRFNRVAEKLSGLSFAQVEGRFPWETVLPSEQAAQIKTEAFTAVMDEGFPGRTSRYVNEWIAAGGSRRLIEWNNSVMRSPDGEADYMVCIGIDITERRQLELALRLSEERLRTIISSEPECVKIVDSAGRLLDMNPAGLRMLGVSSIAEVRGRDLLDFIAPDDRAIVQAASAAVFAGESRFDCYRIRALDGTERWVEQHAAPLRDPAAPKNIIQLLAVTRDITERRRAEMQTRLSEARLKEAQRLAKVGSWELDLRSGQLFWTDEIFTLFEIDRRQFGASYEAFLAAIHPADRKAVDEAYTRSLRDRTPYSIAHRLLMPNGRIKWVEERCTTEFSLDGTPHVSRGTVQDITETKLLELALRALSTELAHLSGPDYLHAASERLLALLEADDAFIGRWDANAPDKLQLLAHCHQGQRQPERSHLLSHSYCARVLQNGQPLVTDDSQDFLPIGEWIRCPTPRAYAAAPIRDSASRIVGLVGAVGNRPWSNLHRVETILSLFAVALGAELESQRSHTRFQALFEFSPDAIVMTDHTGLIRLVNQRAVELFGWSRDEMVGQTVELLMPPAERSGHIAKREHYVAHARPRQMGKAESHLHARRKDGSVFPADISLSPIETEEGMLVAAAVRDTTKQREAEELRRRAELDIRQAQKMESLGTLAGGIAHDFNNILTGMFGFVELARMDLPESHPARTWVEQIHASAQRAKNLVRQILTFSRKDVQKEHVPTRLQSVVNEALDLLRSSVPAMVSIERRLAKDCPPVMADATQMHQVVMNLGTNAWRALPETGGRILVELAPCNLTGRESVNIGRLRPGPALRLSVTDTGCGMEPAAIERIFDPFYTTRAVGEGTGLGLSVVHGIVLAHEGAIHVSSTPGRGTRFDIYLPALTHHEPSQSEAPVAPPTGNGELILLVDDDVQGAQAMLLLLEKIGYRVSHCTTPQVALNIFRDRPAEYHLVITDFAMPGMSGLRLCQELSAVRADIPMLLISGNLGIGSSTSVSGFSLAGILHKPISLVDLANAVQTALANRS